MTLTIETDAGYNKPVVYHLSAGEGLKCDAHSINELHLAIDHYFGGKTHVDGCPICRELPRWQSRKVP